MQLIPLLQICARAKGAPGTRDHRAPQRRLGIEPIPQRGEPLVLGRGDGVELGRAIERDEQNVRGWEGEEGVGNGGRRGFEALGWGGHDLVSVCCTVFVVGELE